MTPGGDAQAQAGVATVAVAVSGGRDSMGLLHATLRAAESLGLHVAALHVHHGLMAEADAWAEGLRVQCQRWIDAGRPLSFALTRLPGRPSSGESVEAWARRERYAALARLAHEAGADLVLLGHHRSDQAETVLLQALRGAGAAGLAAMPRSAERAGLTWARPWLEQSTAAVDAYVAAAGLTFVVDPSNADPRYARSRLRQSVMPVLRAAFADAEQALAGVAGRAQEARAVLDEVALEDLRRLGAGEELALQAWRRLTPARRANALRAWLAARLGRGAPDTLVRRVLDETSDDATRRWPVDGGRWLRSWRGRLSLVAPSACEDRQEAPPQRLRLLRCAEYAVPGWSGSLEVFATDRCGVAPHRLADVVARMRVGGERFKLEPAATARSLKKQFQSAGLAAEGRGGPLLFDAHGELLFVPGLGVDARAWAEPGRPQWGLRWHSSVPEPVRTALES